MKVSEAWQNVVCQMLFVLFCIAILIFFSPAFKAWNVWTFLKPFVARFRVRKEEDKVGVRRLAWLYSINQNHKTKVALLARFTKANLFTITQFPGLLQFSEQSVSISLNLVSLSLWLPLLSEALLSGLFTPITAIRHRCSSFCTWHTYSPLVSRCSLSRCRLRWTTPPSPHPYLCDLVLMGGSVVFQCNIVN